MALLRFSPRRIMQARHVKAMVRGGASMGDRTAAPGKGEYRLSARAGAPAWSGATEPGLPGAHNRLRPAFDLELLEDVRDVVAHGLLGALPPRCDLRAGQGARD